MIREIDGSPLDALVWGGKASGLAKLVAVGLPVPPALSFRPGAVAGSGGAQIIQRWLNSHPARAYVLRSSSLIEDLDDRAGAGISTTLVDLAGEPTCLQFLAVDQIEPTLQGGSVILQVQANCLYAGVAFVDNHVVTVEANLRSVTATTSGETPVMTATITASRIMLRLDRGHVGQPFIHVLRQVTALSVRAAEVYGGTADIEWVHDGATCQVVQARPQTRKLVA